MSEIEFELETARFLAWNNHYNKKLVEFAPKCL